MTAGQDVEILLVDDNPSDVELTIYSLRQNSLTDAIYVAEDGNIVYGNQNCFVAFLNGSRIRLCKSVFFEKAFVSPICKIIPALDGLNFR